MKFLTERQFDGSVKYAAIRILRFALAVIKNIEKAKFSFKMINEEIRKYS